MNTSQLKLTVICLCLALGLANAAAPLGKPTGQPGCQTEEELSVGFYRHYYLKANYWICTELGVPATLSACPVPSAWLDDVKACVPWSQWYWTPTQAPPSEPAAVAAAVVA